MRCHCWDGPTLITGCRTFCSLSLLLVFLDKANFTPFSFFTTQENHNDLLIQKFFDDKQFEHCLF